MGRQFNIFMNIENNKMSWLNYIFSKKEKHVIRGTKIVIINNTDSPNKEFIRACILEFCNRVPMMRLIPKAVFYIEDFKKPHEHIGEIAAAYVERKNDLHVHINVEIKTKEKMFNLLAHEISHYKKREISIINIRVRQRISKSIKKLGIINYYRLYLRDFIFAVLDEGYATFNGYTLIGKVKFNNDEFLRYYNLAKNEAEEFMSIWSKYVAFYQAKDPRYGDLVKSLETLYRRSYKVGFHIHCTLVYSNKHVKIDDKIFNIIKIYEATIISMGYKPIISVNSGKGILDYNSLIASWYNLHKNS